MRIFSGLLKKNRLEILVSNMKKSAQLHASNKQNFASPRFFKVNGISIVFSREGDVETGESIFEKV